MGFDVGGSFLAATQIEKSSGRACEHRFCLYLLYLKVVSFFLIFIIKLGWISVNIYILQCVLLYSFLWRSFLLYNLLFFALMVFFVKGR